MFVTLIGDFTILIGE